MESQNRANITLVKARALANQVPSLEAQKKELEAELQSSRDSVIKLEEQVGNREVETTKKDEYIALLQNASLRPPPRCSARRGRFVPS